MYIATGQGQTTPGDKILMSTETSCHFGHLLQVSKNISEVWFYAFYFLFFSWFYTCIKPRAGADNPLGTKFYCQQDHLVTSDICCKFQKNLFEVWFYTFFHDFMHVYSPEEGADSPPGDKVLLSTEMYCHFIHLLQVSKTFSEVWFYTIVFHDSICMHIAPGQWHTAPRGQTFDVYKKALSFYPFVTSFKEIFLKLWFYTFFHDLIHVYSPGAGDIQSPGDKSFDVNRNFLSLRSSVASFKS